MKLKYIIAAFIFLLTGLSACKKANLAEVVGEGEALNTFKLSAPSNFTKLVLNSATPDKVVQISWTASSPGLKAAAKYLWVAALKGGNIDAPILSLPADNGGKATTLTLTHRQIDDALAGKGVPEKGEAELIWTVVADNDFVKLKATDVYNIAIKRFGDGLSSFVLLGPATSLTPVITNPSSTTSNLTFRWTAAKVAAGKPVPTYSILFAERKVDADGIELPIDWSNPLFTYAADNAGADTMANITYKAMSDLLTANGFTNLSQTVQLKWTVKALTGEWNQWSDYVNDLGITREIKVYIVGGATPGGWDISQSTRMIEDPRFAGTYFSYIKLNSGEIKFVNGQVWPPAEGAVDWGQDPAAGGGTFTADGENNIPIPAAGVYRVTFDLPNKKYYLQTAVSNGIGGMGMIGDFQGWSHPATKMTYLSVNKFILIASMNTNNQFKFHDGNAWDNGSNILNRWFSLNKATNKMVDASSSDDNFKWTGGNGLVRAIWDGSDTRNLQYTLNPATEMRVVGNGMNGVPEWNPGASPQMAYQGNGVWTITLNLVGDREIKFLAGNDWGAFDYEDNSGQSNSTGVPRPVKWDGNDNFKTPSSSGSYTITLDEYNQTVTIN